MSRVIGRGRYATETYPSGPGGGGGAGGASVPFARQRFIDGDTAQTGLNGSAAEPYETIEQFMTARDNTISAADSAANFVGWLMPALAGYVEDVAFRARCSTELRADSMSVPGTGGVTIDGDISWTNTSGTAAAPAAIASLHNINVTGTITVTDNAESPELLFSISGDEEPGGSSAVIGGFDSSTTTTLASISLNNAQCTGDLTAGVAADSAVVILTGGSIITGDITAKALQCNNAVIDGAVTVNAAGFAIFRASAFAGACALTAATSSFDGDSWLSFLANGGTRVAGTTVLVTGGASTALVEGAALTGASTNVSLNGTGATAGFTGANSGNHYTTSNGTPTTVTLKTGGGELVGDTMLITKTDLGANVVAVKNNAGAQIASIPTLAKGFVLARFNGSDWVFVSGGSMLA